MLSKKAIIVLQRYLAGGLSKTAIAPKLGVTRRTVQRYAKSGKPVVRYGPRPPRPAKLVPSTRTADPLGYLYPQAAAFAPDRQRGVVLALRDQRLGGSALVRTDDGGRTWRALLDYGPPMAGGWGSPGAGARSGSVPPRRGVGVREPAAARRRPTCAVPAPGASATVAPGGRASATSQRVGGSNSVPPPVGDLRAAMRSTSPVGAGRALRVRGPRARLWTPVRSGRGSVRDARTNR